MCLRLPKLGSNPLTRSTSEEIRKNAEIEKILRKDKKQQAKNVKILLLGAGESGKSTILKQMRLIYAAGFPAHERKEIRQVIFANMVTSFRVVTEEMRDYGYEYADDQTQKCEAILLVAEDIGVNDSFPIDCLSAMKGLWQDPSIQKTIKRGNEYALHDNILYFYHHIDRLFKKDYIPTDQDILRSRLRTTGITETLFELGQLNYHMFDVGGQRSERKKWVHCFEGVHCLLFVASLSGYDQCLVEDKTSNQMQEALMLFESILNLQWFKKSSIILFLNKMDLFKAKLAEKPIRDYFPDYSGVDTDVTAAGEYFAKKFRGLNRTADREIYIHYTNATDTNLLKITMQSVQDTIIQNNLNSELMATTRESNATGNFEALANMGGEYLSAFSIIIFHDVHTASFFSLHRPISVTAVIPPYSSPSTFSSIFTPRTQHKSHPADVIHTLSAAVNTFEKVATQSDINSQSSSTASASSSNPHPVSDEALRVAVTLASTSNAEPTSPTHLDSHVPQIVYTNIEELARAFRPFNPPPAPVPMPAKADRGATTSRARSSPLPSRALPISPSFFEASPTSWAAIKDSFRRKILDSSLDSFRERMRSRHLQWLEKRVEQRREMWRAISVKRQRRLKIKKHK
ncbi:hypothetical protein MMC27_001993 [Xylographa pallens]|nr:hypothetical protein [Xylographa pallens]